MTSPLHSKPIASSDADKDDIMTFKNEYVPKIEDETSDFLRGARSALRVGFSRYDMWTVDRDNNMALARTGAGHDEDSSNEEYWKFVAGDQVYRFFTNLIEKRDISHKAIYLQRRIGFFERTPDASVMPHIKAALQTYGDYGVISKYESCELVLKNAAGEVL